MPCGDVSQPPTHSNNWFDNNSFGVQGWHDWAASWLAPDAEGTQGLVAAVLNHRLLPLLPTRVACIVALHPTHTKHCVLCAGFQT